MLKIIKRAVRYRVPCQQCKSIIEFDLNDIDWSKAHFGEFTCPDCACQVHVKDRNGAGMLPEVTPVYDEDIY